MMGHGRYHGQTENIFSKTLREVTSSISGFKYRKKEKKEYEYDYNA